MPSFDVVSEVDLHTFTNAVDQAVRTVANRFDFKGIDCGYERKEMAVVMHAESDYQLRQMLDILRGAIAKCNIDPRAMDAGKVEQAGRVARQTVTMKNGLETEVAKKIVKMIKDQKFKVQAQIQAEQVRVTGKKRDDLQTVIAFLRGNEDVDVPLQFENFRD